MSFSFFFSITTLGAILKCKAPISHLRATGTMAQLDLYLLGKQKTKKKTEKVEQTTYIGFCGSTFTRPELLDRVICMFWDEIANPITCKLSTFRDSSGNI